MCLSVTIEGYQESNMEQVSLLRGGVSLCHSLVDDKHYYEVENALTHCGSTFRKGDKISMINNTITQDLPPEEFTRMLSSKCFKLTLHQANIDMKEGQCLESDSIQAFTKENIRLNFHLAMVREECLKAEEEIGLESMWESDNMEDKELLLVSMTQTNVAVVTGRGCDSENPCNNCTANGCEVNDVLMAADNCEVTSVSCQSVIMSTKRDVVMCSLVEKWCLKNVSFSEDITIYYYCSTIIGEMDRGSPVVLNFTGTNNFLKCTFEDQKVGLTIETCNKTKLNSICKDDSATWPFVFYLKTEGANNRVFESAKYTGWYIQTEQPVSIGRRADKSQENFYFLLYSKNE